MADVTKLLLEIMKEVTALKNPHKPGINHTVYKKLCKGLNTELFQPPTAFAYPELEECFNFKMGNFPLKNMTANALTAKASVRKIILKRN